MTKSSAIQQQINISATQAADHAYIDSFLALVPSFREIEQCNLSALHEDVHMLDPHIIVTQDVLNAEDGHHQIPGPLTTSENGDPVNSQILEDEQRDVEAARTLGLAIENNDITVQHYRWIVMTLRDKLDQADPHEIPLGEAYSRVILRLTQRLVTCPNEQDPEYVPYSRPRNYVQCLGMLLNDMAEGFIIMRQTGIEDCVYLSKNMEIHIDHLSSLASRLIGA